MFINLVPYNTGFDEIRIDDHDTWSMDVTLARIIVPMLRQLKERRHGVPSSFIPNDHHTEQLVFDFISDELRNEEVNLAAKKWDDVTDKMIWSFDRIAHGQYHGHDVPPEYGGDYDAFHRDIEEGVLLFAKHYGSLWD